MRLSLQVRAAFSRYRDPKTDVQPPYSDLALDPRFRVGYNVCGPIVALIAAVPPAAGENSHSTSPLLNKDKRPVFCQLIEEQGRTTQYPRPACCGRTFQ